MLKTSVMEIVLKAHNSRNESDGGDGAGVKESLSNLSTMISNSGGVGFNSSLSFSFIKFEKFD